jgi:hypothetical protein
MKGALDIVIQYAQADLSEKIYLFLQFPGLRDVFGDIDRKGYHFPVSQLNGIERKAPCSCSCAAE